MIGSGDGETKKLSFYRTKRENSNIEEKNKSLLESSRFWSWEREEEEKEMSIFVSVFICFDI